MSIYRLTMSTVLAKVKVMKLRALINLLSSFIAHSRRNNKDKDLLTSRSCLIFQWFHQRNAVSGLAEIFPIDFLKILNCLFTPFLSLKMTFLYSLLLALDLGLPVPSDFLMFFSPHVQPDEPEFKLEAI